MFKRRSCQTGSISSLTPALQGHSTSNLWNSCERFIWFRVHRAGRKEAELQSVKLMFYLASTARVCSELGLMESSQTFQQAQHKGPDSHSRNCTALPAVGYLRISQPWTGTAWLKAGFNWQLNTFIEEEAIKTIRTRKKVTLWGGTAGQVKILGQNPTTACSAGGTWQLRKVRDVSEIRDWCAWEASFWHCPPMPVLLKLFCFIIIIIIIVLHCLSQTKGRKDKCPGWYLEPEEIPSGSDRNECPHIFQHR